MRSKPNVERLNSSRMTNMLCTRTALNTPGGDLQSSHEFPEDDDIWVTTKKFQNISTRVLVSNSFVYSKFCFVPVNSFQTPLIIIPRGAFVETFQGERESLLNLLREVRGFVEPTNGVFQKVQEPLLQIVVKFLRFICWTCFLTKTFSKLWKLRTPTHIFLRRVRIGGIHD